MPTPARLRQCQRHHEHRDAEDRADIPANTQANAEAVDPKSGRRVEPDRLLEGAPSPGDQVISRIAHAIGFRRVTRLCRRRECRLQGFVGDVEFRKGRAPGQLLDRAPIDVTGRKIHRRKGACRTQPLIDEADAFDQFRPIDVRHQPHAGDDVAHGDVRCALPPLDVLDHLLDRAALACQPLFEPTEGRRRRRIEISQSFGQLSGKGFRQRLRCMRGSVGLQVRLGAAVRQQQVSQCVGVSARLPPGRHLIGEPAQIFDQDDAQRDDHRPQFADGQRLDSLIGDNESTQGFGIDAAVGMGDQSPGKAEDPRIARKRPVGQFRQLAIVAGRQIVPDLANLLLDEVVVVEEPLSRRHNAAAVLQLRGARTIGREQDRGIVVEAFMERRDIWRCRCHRLRRREAFGVALEPFDTEELFSYRCGVVPGRRAGAISADISKDRVHQRLSLRRRAAAAAECTARPPPCEDSANLLRSRARIERLPVTRRGSLPAGDGRGCGACTGA